MSSTTGDDNTSQAAASAGLPARPNRRRPAGGGGQVMSSDNDDTTTTATATATVAEYNQAWRDYLGSSQTTATPTAPPMKLSAITTTTTQNAAVVSPYQTWIPMYNECWYLATQPIKDNENASSSSSSWQVIDRLYSLLQPFFEGKTTTTSTTADNPSSPPPPPTVGIAMGCLLLDCIWTVTAGDFESYFRTTVLSTLSDKNKDKDTTTSSALMYHHYYRDDNNDNNNDDRKMIRNISLTQIMEWMQSLLAHMATALPSSHTTEEPQEASSSSLYYEYYSAKLTLGLYAAKMELCQSLLTMTTTMTSTANNNSNPTDGHIKAARKELKQAMEVYSTKLKWGGGSGNSAAEVESQVSNLTTPSHYGSGIGMAETNTHTTSTSGGAPAVSMTLLPDVAAPHNHHHHHNNYNNNNNNNNNHNNNPVLQEQHQAALLLKAHTEQLKGNMKKALVLVQEASSATTPSNSTTSAATAIHANNLAYIYATCHKSHLAHHTWTKAVLGNVDTTTTTTSTTTLSNLVWNWTVAALNIQDYLGAYTGLTHLLSLSNHNKNNTNNMTEYSQRPKVWRNLGQACLGIHAQQQKQHNAANDLVGMTVGASVRGVALGGRRLYNDQNDGRERTTSQLPEYPLGSPQDIEQVQRHPLPRAQYALEMTLHLYKKNRYGPVNDDKTSSTSTTPNAMTVKDRLSQRCAWVSLAYICLEQRNFAQALEYAHQVGQDDLLSSASSSSGMGLQLDKASQTLARRQDATARMYAAEASAALGHSQTSLHYLAGQDSTRSDALDRLAVDLSGITLETASVSSKAKARLAKAQAMVRCSASAASACCNQMGASKQLAMSAQANSREGSYATKALLYGLLKEGKHGSAACWSLIKSSSTPHS